MDSVALVWPREPVSAWWPSGPHPSLWGPGHLLSPRQFPSQGVNTAHVCKHAWWGHVQPCVPEPYPGLSWTTHHPPPVTGHGTDRHLRRDEAEGIKPSGGGVLSSRCQMPKLWRRVRVRGREQPHRGASHSGGRRAEGEGGGRLLQEHRPLGCTWGAFPAPQPGLPKVPRSTGGHRGQLGFSLWCEGWHPRTPPVVSKS